jgi:hypothetical protein
MSKAEQMIKQGKTPLLFDLRVVLVVRACGAASGGSTGPSIREGCD